VVLARPGYEVLQHLERVLIAPEFAAECELNGIVADADRQRIPRVWRQFAVLGRELLERRGVSVGERFECAGLPLEIGVGRREWPTDEQSEYDERGTYGHRLSDALVEAPLGAGPTPRLTPGVRRCSGEPPASAGGVGSGPLLGAVHPPAHAGGS